MKPPVTPFSVVYRQTLDALWGMIPGARELGSSEEVVRKEEQRLATQEWEDEGGSIPGRKP